MKFKQKHTQVKNGYAQLQIEVASNAMSLLEEQHMVHPVDIPVSFTMERKREG